MRRARAPTFFLARTSRPWRQAQSGRRDARADRRLAAGLPGSAPDKDGKNKKDDAQQPALKDAMTAKATNDAVALIRSLAELRGRNADWPRRRCARPPVFRQRRIAGECHRSRRAQPDRIASADRRPHGRARRWRYATVGDKGLTIERLDPGWLIRLLSVITNPNVAFILLMVASTV